MCWQLPISRGSLHSVIGVLRTQHLAVARFVSEASGVPYGMHIVLVITL